NILRHQLVGSCEGGGQCRPAVYAIAAICGGAGSNRGDSRDSRGAGVCIGSSRFLCLPAQWPLGVAGGEGVRRHCCRLLPALSPLIDDASFLEAIGTLFTPCRIDNPLPAEQGTGACKRAPLTARKP